MLKLQIDGRTVRHAVGSWGRTARLCTVLLAAGFTLAAGGAAAALVAHVIRG